MSKSIEEVTGELKQCVYVFAGAVYALANIEGMKAENLIREQRGESLAFDKDDFDKVSNENPIRPSFVLGYLDMPGQSR